MLSFANQVIETCPSTNDLGKLLAAQGYPHGTWVSSKKQDAGRGRMSRAWTSLEGNLFLSYLSRIEAKELWSWIPLTAAVATVEYLSLRFQAGGFRVKWPNDVVWVSQGVVSKLGGILCEGSVSATPFVVIGLGLNCNSSPSSEALGREVSHLTRCLGQESVSVDEVREGIVQALSASLARLEKEGSAWVSQAYQEKWASLLPGTEVFWGNPRMEGQVVGLGRFAELLVKTESVSEMKLFAEEVQVRVVRSHSLR